ncbi:MAG: transporter substrate-binding domain-containing protein [Burkholderiales bacterium]
MAKKGPFQGPGGLSQSDSSGGAQYHFKTQSGGPPPVALAEGFLSRQEREFLEQLPEIRVALQVVGAPPYETVSASGEIAGFQADLLSHLAKTLGLRLRPVVLPDWPSVLQAVKDGQADMVLTLSVSPERMKFLEFTLGTVPVPAAVFARQHGNAKLPDITQARIALEREYYSNDLVRRLYPQARIVPTLTTLEALRAVSEGQADYYVGSLLEALDLLSRQPVAGIEVQEVLHTGNSLYHFGIRKDWAPLAAILNKGISRFRSDPGPNAWAATAASIPASGMAWPRPLPLSDDEAERLSKRAVWRIGAVRGLALLNDVDASGAHSGIASEYTDHVARRLGVGIELVAFDNVAAMLDGLRQGKIDFVPFLTQTEERAREFVFSKPYFEMPYMLVARSDAPLYWGLSSLQGKRLALAPAHPLRDLVAKKYPTIEMLAPKNGMDAMDMVARGDADAAVEIKVFANLRINADSAGRLRAVGAVDELPAQFRFAASKNADAALASLLPLVDRVLDEVPAGERERMLRRWVAIDFNPPFPWRRHVPALVVASSALLLMLAGTVWWMRRLRREVLAKRRAVAQLDDIGRTVRGVAFQDVYAADGTLQRRFFSSGTLHFLGWEPGPGQTVLQGLKPHLRASDATLLQEQLELHLERKQALKFTGLYLRPGPPVFDGSIAPEMWLQVDAVVRQTEGEVFSTGYVVDVSSERHLQERLAKEASERHLLLASASHELRAPTHTLSLALQTLSSDGWPEPAARSLRIAKEASRTLAQLLNDVLDVARFDAGHVELRPQDFDLLAVIEQVRESHSTALAAKRLTFECVVASDVPQMVFLDPLRLKQVLTNLLSNATRYTQHGGVTLRVEMAAAPVVSDVPKGHWMPMLSFLVSDTGVGLPPDRHANPFAPFGRVAPLEGGSGLGLSICRRLVEMMGGRIELASQSGVGTQARVWLPVTVRASAAERFPATGVLLLCDDDSVSRMLVAQGLLQQGFEVEEADGGDAALARLRQGGVRALITDLSMPGLGGAQLIQRWREEEAQRPAAASAAVIICSGNPAPLALAQHPGLNHDVFLTKPVDVKTLVQALVALGITPANKHATV